MTPGEEIEVLDPPVRSLDIAGERIEIRPLTIGRLGAVMRALRPALEDIRAPHESPDEEFDLAIFAARYSAETIAAVAAATGREWEWVDALSPEDFLDLAGVLVEVNIDFLSRLEPGLRTLTARLQAAAGSISSASSSPPGSGSVM